MLAKTISVVPLLNPGLELALPDCNQRRFLQCAAIIDFLFYLTAWYFLLGLASLELLYSGSNHIYLLGHSLSKPLTTPHNPSHSPVGSLKAPSWVHSSSFYTPHR